MWWRVVWWRSVEGGGVGADAERGVRCHAGSGQSARTSRAKGSFLINSSVDRWYLRISRSATVPGLRVPELLTGGAEVLHVQGRRT